MCDLPSVKTKAVLEAVQVGLDERPAALDLPLDSGPMRFRRRLQQLIEAEQAATLAVAE